MITVTAHKSINSRCAPVQPGIWQRLGRLLAVTKQRRRLADLDDHLLRDIGLTREQANQEAKRRVWDVPGHWQDKA